MGVSWMPPMPLRSQVSLNGRFASGKMDTVEAFVPITTSFQGDILKAKFSGLSVLSLDYTARLHQSFSVNLAASYFIRTDQETYNGYPMGGFAGSQNHFLGGECIGRLMWSPVSDLSLNLGGSAFLPSWGDAAPDADIRWRLELGFIFALY
jgi:hypothetical protein